MFLSKRQQELVFKAKRKHGDKIVPCNGWARCFTEHEYDGVVTLVFWYDTEDRSTHCVCTDKE